MVWLIVHGGSEEHARRLMLAKINCNDAFFQALHNEVGDGSNGRFERTGICLAGMGSSVLS